MIPKVASKWYELGIELYRDFDVPRLDIIQKQHPTNFTEGCKEMLTTWLGTHEDTTWDTLIKALKAPSLQLNAVALDIKKEVVSFKKEAVKG